MFFSKATIISAIFGLAFAQAPGGGMGMVKVHTVQVGGPNGSLAFFPNNVVAQPGDMVQFQFHPKNHSVVQSTFDNPCIPIQNVMPNKTDAFFSGFMPTNASFTAKNQVMTYTIRVTDTKPIWYYCSQGKHCQAGMVGAINAPQSGNKTMQAFTALAAQATENLSPGQGAGSGGSAGGSNGGVGNTPTSPTSGNGADAGGAGGAGGSASGSGTSGAPAQATGAASTLSSQSFVGVAAAVVAMAFGAM
ncbi:uncharacterized protein yc1106_07539 [Curvularia clavata]|uniref:Blue (type 1) copper domain-containing protein n=1 Tax=Curvularia clavata TaxID=95742 RepID=A0A9Q8ZDK3_CURCL|nr:uncharacterized protein yc1106_07539 [Curvularia clavata]